MFQEDAIDKTHECVQPDEYASVVLRIQKFIEQAEGRYIQQALCNRFEIENLRLQELAPEAYAPHVAAEMAQIAGRLDVLRWLTNGQFGFAHVED